MKKPIIILSVIFCVLVFAYIASADVENLYQANQITIAWDDQECDFYRIFTKSVSGGAETDVSTVTENSFVYSFTEVKAVVFGVQAVVMVDVPGLEELVENASEISWSDIIADCLNGKTFGVYYVGDRIPKATGLRK